jgi:monoamine oxidase
MESEPLRIVVVGAGPSGLAAADRLAASSSPVVSVVVLEAAGRVGGRTLSVPLESHPGVRADLGGQWVGTKQTALRLLVNDFGLGLTPQHVSGLRVLDLNSVLSTYSGLVPNTSLLVLLDAQVTLFLLSIFQLFLHFSPAGALARLLDSMTVAQLAGKVMWTRGGRALVTIVVQGLFGLEPAELSALALCRYAMASGGLEAMTESGPNSLQESTIVGGAQQISERLAARAIQHGAALFVGHAVTQISQRTSGSVTVVCANGATFECNRVVVAVPPPIAGAIVYSPPLSEARQGLMRDAAMGGIIKALVVYSEPFWRGKGLSGEVICDTAGNPRSPAFNVFDNCLPDPANPGRPVASLVVFINGMHAREFSACPAEERRLAVLGQLARYFGDEALTPVEYLEHDWVSDPFTRGCPIASYGRSVLSSFGAATLLSAHEAGWGARLLFASTETSDVSTGFIDGALRAGYRAASEALETTTATPTTACIGPLESRSNLSPGMLDATLL